MSPSETIEFLLWLLIAASTIAVLAARWRVPYTVALVIGGLLLGSFRLPVVRDLFHHSPDWLTPNVSLVIFLPALLFEGSIKIRFSQLRENLLPITLLATVGVLAATGISGLAVHWVLGIPLLVAFVFGSIVSATDPISVLAIFKDMPVERRLSVIVEGESLFNDGTAVVLYGILFAAVAQSQLSILAGLQKFVVDVAGGIAIGGLLGFGSSKITQRIDDPQIEITLTTILAYGAFLLAQSVHVSGVIATVTAGLVLGNLGVQRGMSSRTRIALWSFWEYASFLINSILFLLIGLQVRVLDLLHAWKATSLTIGAVVVARMLVVYGLVPFSNLRPPKISLRWQHVLVWGGMRGALSLALALSLNRDFPYREELLTMTFGVVAFTIIVQGITIKPLLRLLGTSLPLEDDYSCARVHQIAVASALSELDDMHHRYLISRPNYDRLKADLDASLSNASDTIEVVFKENQDRLSDEFEMAKRRLVAAEKSSIEQALHDGLLSTKSASRMFDQAERSFDGRKETPQDLSRNAKLNADNAREGS
ncbi:MAG: Na+/H+ antiporter [Terriglobales bacterium]